MLSKMPREWMKLHQKVACGTCRHFPGRAAWMCIEFELPWDIQY